MPGTVLLLAASPVGKGCLVDAASVLPVLAAVPPAILAGTDTANVVELADPLEPQAVLTRLRAAATAPGPLTVFVTGQLHLDRRQRLPHLALARTTPSTVRYTAFPWHWFREELRLRQPGSTTVYADLHADQETWDHLRAHPLDCGPGVRVHGRLAPPPSRRRVAAPAYMKAVATILRSGWRPPEEQLHQQAWLRLTAGEGGLELFGMPAARPLGPAGGTPRRPTTPPQSVPQPLPQPLPQPRTAAPVPVPVPGAGLNAQADTAPLPVQAPDTDSDPHVDIATAVQDGRHMDADALAARHEQDAVREHGPASEEALHWSEVRADLAMFAGDAERSCRAWLKVAGARLAAGQAPDTPAVEAAADRAHHQWGRIGDAASARELGPALAELRGRVPGRHEGALENVRTHLRQLQTQG
ncbi:hypothetical protein [Streptomyces griseus]|uniref:hypothetical protein n=1 Tax=Streptomyces griseus TaxID=1911 RepID=UPI000566F254|nr:hypothetical protein [Streptomyces griseus]